MKFFSIWPEGSLAGMIAIMLCITAPASAQQLPSSILPEDTEARQAAAVAASVIPPEHVTSDVVRLAGEYSYGNGYDLNCTLEISPDGHFLYKSCKYDRVIDQAAGCVVLQNGQLVLQPQIEPGEWPKGMGNVLMPVAWGQRLYLVPANDIRGFSNQVNRGLEPVRRGNMGSYFLREGDWDRPVVGKPDLPEEWKDRLLEKPVTGLVAGRDPSNRWIIDLGKDHGVYDGMELSAWAPGLRQFVTILVTETGTHTSAIKIVGAPENTRIQGWTVYSRVVPPGQENKP